MTYLGQNLPYIYIQGGNQANAELALFAGSNVSFSVSTYDWDGYYSGANLTINAGAGGGAYSAGMSNIGNTSGTTGMASNRLVLAGGNNVTLSQSTATNGNTITISAASQTVQTQNRHNVTLSGNTAGFMAQISSGTMTLAGGDNVTVSQFGNAVSINAGGGGPALSWKQIYHRQNMTNITHLSAINGRFIFQPFYIEGDIAPKTINWEMSRSTTGSNNFAVWAGIYTYVNSTQISRLVSTSFNYSNTATASISGVRMFALTGLTDTLTAGNYVLAMLFYDNNAGSASMNYLLRGGQTVAPHLGVVMPGTNSYETATSGAIYPFFGRYTTTGGGMPFSVAASEVIGQFSGASQPINWWVGIKG